MISGTISMGFRTVAWRGGEGEATSGVWQSDLSCMLKSVSMRPHNKSLNLKIISCGEYDIDSRR